MTLGGLQVVDSGWGVRLGIAEAVARNASVKIGRDTGKQKDRRPEGPTGYEDETRKDIL